jgi:hypothetical protein
MIEWRECYGFPGYSVSNTGIVKSTVVSKRNPKGDMNLSLFPNSSGYPSVDLLIAPKTFKKVLVHRLVCEAFHGPRPEGAVTRHLDGSRTNNNSENLCWGTAKENVADMIKHGRHNARPAYWSDPEKKAIVLQKIRETRLNDPRLPEYIRNMQEGSKRWVKDNPELVAERCARMRAIKLNRL